MRACRRGPAPTLLTEQGAAICAEFAARRAADPSHRFEWRRALRPIVRDELAAMTDERCAYCDGDLRPGPVQEHIDHFRPKSRPEFFMLVCAWENLFLVCSSCNSAKGDRWHELLLKPDDLDFHFERYFSYAYDTDKLEPNPAASPADAERARVTIELLGLNRGKQPASRKRARQWAAKLSAEDRQDLSYRFLLL